MALALRLTVSKAEPLRRGQEHFWRVARTLGADRRTFTAAQIAELSDEPHIGTIVSWLRRLEKAGIIAASGRQPSPSSSRRETAWSLLRSPETLPVISRDGSTTRPRTARQQMWNVMRGPAGRTGFTYGDLVTFGSTDDLSIGANTAKSFIQEMRQGGYLIQLDRGGPGRPAIWRLRPAMNSGPLPPMTLTGRVIYDQNRGRLSGEVVAHEVPS
jgi:hypothetical protein